MTYIAGICLLLAAAALRTRLGRIWLALHVLKASNALHKVGANALDNLEADHHG